MFDPRRPTSARNPLRQEPSPPTDGRLRPRRGPGPHSSGADTDLVVAEPGEFDEEEEDEEYREPLVADKDARPGVRQYFMEQAVVVEEAPGPRETLPEIGIREIELPVEPEAPSPAVLPAVPAPTAPRRWRYFFPAMAAVLLVAVVGLLLLLGRQQVEFRDRKAVETVSAEFIVEFTTFNDQTLGQQSEKLKRLTVGGFREEYLELVNDEAYRKYLTDLKGDSKGRIISLAVSKIGKDEAKVIAFVDVSTVNKDRPNSPEVAAARLDVTLVKTKDGWKVDNVAFV